MVVVVEEVVEEFRVEAGVGSGITGTGVVWFDVESEVVWLSASADWVSAFSSISVSCTRELSFTGEELWVTAAIAFEWGIVSGEGCWTPTGPEVFPALERA